MIRLIYDGDFHAKAVQGKTLDALRRCAQNYRECKERHELRKRKISSQDWGMYERHFFRHPQSVRLIILVRLFARDAAPGREPEAPAVLGPAWRFLVE